MRVIGRKLLVYPAQVEHGVDLSNQMIWRNHLVQIKRIKELTLPDFPPTHHEPPPRIIAHRRNHGSSVVSTRVLQQNPPKATELLRHREMTRSAINGLMHRSKTASLDHLVGAQ